MMREIPVGVSHSRLRAVSFVDDEDYDLVSLFNWYPFKSNTCPLYARTEVIISGSRICFFMHRFILGLSPVDRVDHRNGNGLDNQRSNIRVCTGLSNAKNRKLNVDSSTGFKGVTFEFGKYRAQIHCDKRKFHLGMYDTPEEAALAYDDAARNLHREFARTNKDLGLLS
jgi:hypothetical protein